MSSDSRTIHERGLTPKSFRDLGISARLMYGYILSNINVLSASETSFVLVACLIPQDVKEPSLFQSHSLTEVSRSQHS